MSAQSGACTNGSCAWRIAENAVTYSTLGTRIPDEYICVMCDVAAREASAAEC